MFPHSIGENEEPEGTEQVECPQGSVVMYDARTWHRQGVNRSDRDRAALLNAVTPSFVLPMLDQSVEWDQLSANLRGGCGGGGGDSSPPSTSGSAAWRVAGAIPNARERRDLAHMMQAVTHNGRLVVVERQGGGSKL